MKYLLLLLPLVACGAFFESARGLVRAYIPDSHVASHEALHHANECPVAIQALGYVEPVSDTRHLSFELGGLIEQCFCEIGDNVRSGEVLVKLSDQSHRAELTVAQQQLKLEQAERDRVLSGIHPQRLEMARTEHNASRHKSDFLSREMSRNDHLLESNAVSQRAHDRNMMELHVADAQLKRARAQVEYFENYVTREEAALAQCRVDLAQARVKLAETQLAKCSICAPFDGQVLDILHHEGEAVNEITKPPVIVFGRVDRLRVCAEVDEQHIHSLSEGMDAIVTGRNLQGYEFSGHVTLVKPRMGKKTVLGDNVDDRRSLHVVEVFIQLDDKFSAPIGLMVDVAIPLDPTRMDVLPRQLAGH